MAIHHGHMVIELTYAFEISAYHPSSYIYSQTCIKRSPLGLGNSGLIRQVTSLKRFKFIWILLWQDKKKLPFNTGDCMGRFDYMYILLYVVTCQSTLVDGTIYRYVQTCIKRSPLGQRRSGLL